MAKSFVVTARGQRLNMEALKAANPNVIPVGNILERQTREDMPVVQKTRKVRIPKVRANRPVLGATAVESSPEVVEESPIPVKNKNTKEK